MNQRQAAAAATREQIVAAGLRLAERTGLTGMNINAIVDAAGVAKGTFFHHFGDRSGFLVAIHREFHNRLFADINGAITQLPRGKERLLAGAHAYLDGCLRHRGVRALLLEARAEPAIAEAIAQRNRLVIELTEPDFAALGWTHPADAAALWSGLVVEAALLELALGAAKPATRAALSQFLPG